MMHVSVFHLFVLISAFFFFLVFSSWLIGIIKVVVGLYVLNVSIVQTCSINTSNVDPNNNYIRISFWHARLEHLYDDRLSVVKQLHSYFILMRINFVMLVI